jgi:hypothetical protein
MDETFYWPKGTKLKTFIVRVVEKDLDNNKNWGTATILQNMVRGGKGYDITLQRRPDLDEGTAGPEHAGECKECDRNDLFQWLKELEGNVPMPSSTGFGPHEEWVQGMLSGISDHIKGTIASLRQIEKDGLADGTIYGEANRDE